MRITLGLPAAGIITTMATTALAQGLAITSFGSNGELVWTNNNTNPFYRIEWAASLTASNDWHSSYILLTDIRSANPAVTSAVPMFYRICGTSNRIGYAAMVSRTGQTNSYRTGDDGYYTNGVVWPSPRFAVGMGASSNCVTDNLTGLMWLKNPDAVTRSWANAIAHCEGLDGTAGRGGYSDWRLPNRRELESLIDLGQAGPALPAGHPFDIIFWAYYWSSSTISYSTVSAWYVHLDGGNVNGDNKANTYYVWPVRSGK